MKAMIHCDKSCSFLSAVLSQAKDDGTEQSDVEVTSATDAHDDTKTSGKFG